MIGRLQHTILKCLYDKNEPMARPELREQVARVYDYQGKHNYYIYSSTTNSIRTLIKGEYIIQISPPGELRAWYLITKKGKHAVNPKLERKRDLARLKHRVYCMMISTRPVGKVTDLYKPNATRWENYFKHQDSAHKICDDGNMSRSKIDEYMLRLYVEQYVRSYGDSFEHPLLKHYQHLVMERCNRDLVKKLLLKYIRQTIRREFKYAAISVIGDEYHQRNLLRMESLVYAFGLDADLLIKQAKASRQKFLERIKDQQLLGKRCIICGNTITVPDATRASQELQEEVGITAGVVCCMCYNHLQKGDSNEDANTR